ncbi:DUF4031 domain-containing protein [Acuticoccus sediminis]|uniref:DUF4031 domain-containing protein n=1 Tax=Acuticoccus sediminis TaxID=2184697 RepID=UPI001CFD5C3F|nr:DUF4031 domain-containing protein [Acuticoccus sediminis]
MTVYVDDMHKHPMGRFGRMRMSHMAADSTEELLAMAFKVGVSHRHLQHKGTSTEHLDVCLSKREMAVAAGAKEVTMRELVVIMRGKRGAS